MFTSYFVIGLRNLLKSKTHSFINIGGLAVGIASCLLIGLYILDELNYDRFHSNADRIHRIVVQDWAKLPSAVAPALAATYPQAIEKAVRFWPVFSPAKMRHKENVFVESGIVFADAGVFSVFSWPLITGNPSKALTTKNSIVLTKTSAIKYFGTNDPVGQQMKFWGTDLTVTGVMNDIPHNSHLQFDFLVSFSTLEMVMGKGLDERWDMPVFYTYIMTNADADVNHLKNAFAELLQTRSGNASTTPTLQPLTSIHLQSDLKGEFRPGGNMSYLYILGTAAIFILLLAGINFTNLNTARATTRVREVGMRKTLGAMKRQLIQQFFGEALITSATALMIAICIVSLVMPAFNQFAGKPIQLADLINPHVIGGAVISILLISFCAGSYPALYLTRLKPASSLKGSGSLRGSNPVMQKGLIVFQFMVSTFFLTGMVIILLQLNYLQDKDLGFDREQVIVLDGDRFPQLQNELRAVAGVEYASGVPQIIPGPLASSRYKAQGVFTDSTNRMKYYGVTAGFIETMGIEMIQGKPFIAGSEKDEQEAFVLNESAVRELGWTVDEATGKSFSMFVPPLNGGSEVWRHGYITGVVRDFNHDVLYREVTPLVLYPSNDMNLTLVRIQNPDAISAVQKKWSKVNPDAPFNYYFLDDRIRQEYISEEKLGTLMTAATVLAVIIACLGLSGLVSFSASQRTKEIGIRKVMGASGKQMVALLSVDFIKLVAVAAIVSLPLAYYALSIWISNFAYHIELSWIIFLMAGLSTLSIAMITVIAQSLKAALGPPTESLRSE